LRLLLDTHILLWAATDPEQLRSEAVAVLEDESNEVFVSVVTAWEIAIKQSIAKLDLPRPAEQWVPEVLRRSRFEVLDLDLSAALRVRRLPWHHRDPFDRLLVAQAIEGKYTLVTRDEVLRRYGGAVLAG
jgi:PIN domain nuclease of toxin-antitoxin system